MPDLKIDGIEFGVILELLDLIATEQCFESKAERRQARMFKLSG